MMLPFSKDWLRAYFVAGTQDIAAGETLPSVLQAAIDAGITAFQYREKGASALNRADRFNLGDTLRKMCFDAQVPFIVDDDVALAVELNADGIHVGQEDQAIQQVIERTRGTMAVGLSCSTVAEVQAANQLTGLDYIGSGPIAATVSKADADPVIGTAGLAELVQLAQVPIVAIGGITVADLPAIAATGAAGAAVITMITRSQHRSAAIKAMLTAFPAQQSR